MTVHLFPPLDPLSVELCLLSLDEAIRDADRLLTEDRLPAGTGWGAIGGAQISFGMLTELRSMLVAVARQCGFPDRGSVADRARFDFLATAALADFQALDSGESDRDDVWAFIATVLAPDLVAWRFANRPAERFEGGVRNTFQRLWMRAWALDRGPEAGEERWKLVEILTEDALVQLTERPSIGADRRLSLAIASAWAATAERVGTAAMQEVMRKAIIDLRIRNEIQMLAVLQTGELERQVDRIFARAAGLEVPVEVRPSRQESGDRAASVPSVEPGARAEHGEVSGPPMADEKTGELVIQHAILALMLDGREWSNAELKDHLAKALPLTEADRRVGARPAEQLWENRVNNALGQARASSLHAKGFVENRGRGLHAITPMGVTYITGDTDRGKMPAGEASD